jgi:transposase
MQPYFKKFLFKVGSKPTGEYVYTRDRVSIFGALGEKESYFETTEEYCNSQNYIKFLKNLLEKYGKIVIIVDGASYHFEKEIIKPFYEENKENLVVFQLPAYSPELNPIEQWWIPVKEHLANTFWFTKKEFKEKLIEGLKISPKPKLYDYYLR